MASVGLHAGLAVMPGQHTRLLCLLFAAVIIYWRHPELQRIPILYWRRSMIIYLAFDLLISVAASVGVASGRMINSLADAGQLASPMQARLARFIWAKRLYLFMSCYCGTDNSPALASF